MNKRINKTFSITIISIIFIIALFLIFFYALYKIVGIDYGIIQSNNSSESITIDWEKMYPHKEDLKKDNSLECVDNENTSLVKTICERYVNLANKLNTIGDRLKTRVFKYQIIANIGKEITSSIEVVNVSPYIKLKDGQITDVRPYPNKSIESYAKDIKNLSDYCHRAGIEFLYVQPIFKVCKYDDNLFKTFSDYSNIDIDNLLQELKRYDIDCLDLREKLHDSSLDHSLMFYHTDHHWNISAGLWASKQICMYTKSNYGYDFNDEYSNEINYDEKVYRKAMFGSYGQTVGHNILNSEDFSILFPKFETNFILEIKDKNIKEVGSFEKIFINYDVLNKLTNEGGYAYETVLYGNRPLVTIANMNNKNGKRVLIIRDSFAIAVAPYLSTNFSEVDLIDARPKNGNFTGSIKKYIDDNDFDMVIMLEEYPSLHSLE